MSIEKTKLGNPGLPASLRVARCCDTCRRCACHIPHDDPVFYYCWYGAEIPNPPKPPEYKFPDTILWKEKEHHIRDGYQTEAGYVCDEYQA